MGGTGDTVKFQFIGKILGIPHAPGYPLYILLNWLFVHLPWRSVAFRANLMSAFFSILTVFVLYYLGLLIVKRKWISMSTSLLFAFSLSFWSHSVVAEVYTLNSFLLAMIFLSLIRWEETLSFRWLSLFLILYPLSFANHLTMVTLLPAILFFIASVQGRVMLKPRFLAVGLAGILATLGLYSYLFIRSFQRAPYMEHRVVDPKSFFAVLSAGQFRSSMFPFSFNQIILQRIPLFFRHLIDEWTVPLLLLAALGFLSLFKKKNKVAFLLLLSFLGQSFFILNYDIPDLDPLFIPAILILALFTGIGIETLFRLTKKFPPLMPLIIIGLILANIGMIASNYPKADRSGERKEDIRLSALFSSIPDGSIIITDNYLDKQYVYYKIFIDFPNKGLTQLEIASDEEDIRREIFHKIFWKIRTSRELQKRLFPDSYWQLSQDEVEYLFRHSPTLQKSFLAHIYLISPETKRIAVEKGLKVKEFYLRAPGLRKKFTFYQLFLL